jgi:release factor glutamine methyltransferase
MIISKWLKNSINKLESASIPSAKLDAEVLLADILEKDRSWLHAHSEYKLNNIELKKLNRQINRRLKHEPVAYIRGEQEFYGRDFKVTPDTLTPRPETETMIDLLLKTVNSRQFTVDRQLQILDVGTGSGCIIITAALELKKHQISAIGLDISEEALKVAKKNAKNLGAMVKFINFNLLTDDLASVTDTQPEKEPNVILANLPYVPNNFHINLAATHEPGFAIFGGKDGLDYYRLLFKKATKNVKLVFTECLPMQHRELEDIAIINNFKLAKTDGFIQVFSRINNN